MHVQTTSFEHVALKHKASKFIDPTSPIVDESNRFINFSYYLLISNNSQLQL